MKRVDVGANTAATWAKRRRCKWPGSILKKKCHGPNCARQDGYKSTRAYTNNVSECTMHASTCEFARPTPQGMLWLPTGSSLATPPRTHPTAPQTGVDFMKRHPELTTTTKTTNALQVKSLTSAHLRRRCCRLISPLVPSASDQSHQLKPRPNPVSLQSSVSTTHHRRPCQPFWSRVRRLRHDRSRHWTRPNRPLVPNCQRSMSSLSCLIQRQHSHFSGKTESPPPSSSGSASGRVCSSLLVVVLSIARPGRRDPCRHQNKSQNLHCQYLRIEVDEIPATQHYYLFSILLRAVILECPHVLRLQLHEERRVAIPLSFQHSVRARTWFPVVNNSEIVTALGDAISYPASRGLLSFTRPTGDLEGSE